MHDALFWRLPSLLAGFPESEFPGFLRYYEDAKTSRTPQCRSRLSRPAVPAIDCMFRSRDLAIAHPAPGRCSTGFVPYSGALFGSFVRDLPCFLCAPCGFAMFQDPGRTSPSGLFDGSVLFLLTKTAGTPAIRSFRDSLAWLPARCVRFMPASPLTMQHSLTAGGQPLPCRHFRRPGSFSQFRCLCTSSDSGLFTARLGTTLSGLAAPPTRDSSRRCQARPCQVRTDHYRSPCSLTHP